MLTEVATFPEVSGQESGSGGEFWGFRVTGREFCGESLLNDFSISEIWIGSGPETGCVSAETGSNVRQAMGGEVRS